MASSGSCDLGRHGAISRITSVRSQPATIASFAGDGRACPAAGAPRIRAPVRRNYLEIESRNQSLGLAGERLVLDFEQKRLWQAGKKDLANRIEHVAQTVGDHLGFDIKSFELNGRDRLIEVKTTRFGELTPFFASKNEVEFSEERKGEYQLYRLFHFTKQPRLYVLPGSLRESCTLEPNQYSASPR